MKENVLLLPLRARKSNNYYETATTIAIAILGITITIQGAIQKRSNGLICIYTHKWYKKKAERLKATSFDMAKVESDN